MSTGPDMAATHMVDVASMQEAVEELQALARKSATAADLPPVEFALRYGVVPPVVAGRAKELAILRSVVDGIRGGSGDQCLLGLHGIRGQGKTVLIRLLEDMARQTGVRVVTLGAYGSSADFAQALMDAESLAATTGDASAREAAAGVSAVLQAQGRTTKTRQASETRMVRMSIDAALAARLEQGERILLILDEAHILRQEAGQALFNAYQAGAVKGVPLGLAFAGTPDLPDRLSALGISFTERHGRHGQTPLVPISDANAVVAVLAPFAERGALPEDMAAGAPGEIAAAIADACCGYPYYTQLLGDALHQAWAGDGQLALLTQAHWQQALTMFKAERRKHYQRRLSELRQIGAVQCARNLGMALKGQETVSQDVLEECVVKGLRERNALERAGKAIREESWLDGVWSPTGMASALLHLGFLWSPEGGAGDRFQAGIPSLADYVLEIAPPREKAHQV